MLIFAKNQTSGDTIIDLALASDLAQVGGKAFHLQHAITLGVQVPRGFVIPRQALTDFLTVNGLTERVIRYLDGSAVLQMEEQRDHYEQVCAALMAAPIPASLHKAIVQRVDALLAVTPHGLAVRSSGVHEDGANASFAGVYESYLGVKTHEALWKAIRRCWCASWSPQALAYTQKMKLDLLADPMAVIVQALAPAERAGVIFTADPLTGNPWHFVLNTTLGLAQALVDGSAPADRFVVAWDTGEIVERQIVKKRTMLQATAQGMEGASVPMAGQTAPALSDEQVRQVAQLALQLDRAFDCRLDIEWAIAEDALSVVQVRPLTALPSFFPHELSGAAAAMTWTPSDPVWYRTAKAGERLVAPFFQDRWALELWRRHSPGAFFPQQIGEERDFNGYRYQTAWHWGTSGYDLEQTINWLDEHEHEIKSLWLAQQAEMRHACQRASAAAHKAQRALELIPALLDVRAVEIDFMAATWGAPQWMIFTCEWLLKEFLKPLAPDFVVGRLVQGIASLSQTHTEAAQALGRSISEPFVRKAFLELPLDQVLPHLVNHHPASQFLRAYEQFCWQFGMYPPAWPADWRDEGNVQILFAIKKSMMGEGQDARALLDADAAERKAAEAEVHDLIMQCDAALLERFDRLLAWAHFWTPQLDNRGYLHGVIYLHLLNLMRRTGELLVDEGVLERANDLYLLTPQDLTQIAMASDRQSARKRFVLCRSAYERNRRLTIPAHLGQPLAAADAQPQTAPVAVHEASIAITAGSVLQGNGLAPGRVIGVARKTQNLRDTQFLDSLSSEDIVIYPGYRTWPDWLSLFTVVKGVITMQGVQLHHATQIARECGIPYINLPEHHWESIPEGATLALDGALGTVIIESVPDD